jgi:cytidyltransferase-like protein
MKIIIVSGYFNPLHGGHLDMIEAAAVMGDKLIVVVNNDIQQVLKKGKVILSEQNRARLIASLRDVDEVFMSIDDDLGQSQTLEALALKYPNDTLIFANDGDKDSEEVIPEGDICHKYNIEMVFNISGKGKVDSSTRINQALGHAK